MTLSAIRSSSPGGAVAPALAPPPLADVAFARSLTYAAAARALLYPEAQRYGELGAIVEELLSCRDLMTSLALYDDWLTIVTAAEKIAGSNPRQLEPGYVALFATAVPAVPSPPYESAWLEGAFAAGLLYATLERQYAEAGLAPQQTAAEPPDHVAFELEFMAVLCEREADAWERGHDPPSAILPALELPRQFLDRHLCRWMPRFAESVSTHDSACWGPLVQSLARFILQERHLLISLSALAALEGPAHD